MKTNWKTKAPTIGPSPLAALVVALLALVVALSMPAQAAIERLARGSVGTEHLKDGAVTTPKIRNGAVTGPKIRDGSVTLGDLSAPARPKLPRSISDTDRLWKALNSEPGVEIARLDVPAGRWLVTAKAVAATPASMSCYLKRGSVTTDTTFAGSAASWSYDNISLIAPMVAGGATVTVGCAGSPQASVGEIVLSAVEVRP